MLLNIYIYIYKVVDKILYKIFKYLKVSDIPKLSQIRNLGPLSNWEESEIEEDSDYLHSLILNI